MSGRPEFFIHRNEETVYRIMRIITVSGAHSGVGKTSVIEELLAGLKGWSALKVTVSHDGPCPKGKSCGACDDIGPGFSIISDKNVIEEKGKDTGRFKAAGARKVLWLKARPLALAQGLKKAMALLRGADGVIIEGTSALKYIKPDLAILVKQKGSTLKPSARKILKKVDLVWIN